MDLREYNSRIIKKQVYLQQKRKNIPFFLRSEPSLFFTDKHGKVRLLCSVHIRIIPGGQPNLFSTLQVSAAGRG